MFINAGGKVCNVLVSKIRCFEIANVESEVSEQKTETGMRQLAVRVAEVDKKFAALLFICEEIAE